MISGQLIASGQLTGPRVNFATVHSLTSVTVHMNFSLPRGNQGWISDMGIDGPTFVPKSGYFLPILVKVCPQKLAFS